MKTKILSTGIFLILAALITGGCNFPTQSPTEAPTSIPTVEPVAVPDPIFARDAVLTYVGGQYGAEAPPSEITWVEESITPEGLVGSSSFQYSADGWIVTVNFPVVAPEAVIYQVTIVNASTGFAWGGEVDPYGEVTESSFSTEGIEVIGWIGFVASTPEGAQFDDFVVILPEGVGEFGIEGAGNEIQSRIIDLRDKEPPGKDAHFWGTLFCDVLDYNGCQLLVTQLRSGTDAPITTPIEDFEGKIFSNEPGAQFDSYFELEGDYPVRYGITSYIAESGFPVFNDELESLRDTDQIVKVSGDLVCGVPDYFGCQLQVQRLEVDGEEIDPYAGWQEYTNNAFGYRFLYPEGAVITETGVTGFPTDELPEGMSAEEYLAQLQALLPNNLCVSIRHQLGYINISAPENEAARYTICGRTGVGVGELVDKTEEVYIDGGFETADGFEFIGSNESLPEHNETLVIILPNGTRIEYGARPVADATFEDYLLGSKLILLEILSTYESLN
ncbi:MAG: hypothetical protein GTO18_13250 [Anaerolineales bacterium]|nr:hypothetical protein [Anaerolineales bacterium]